MTKSLMVTSPGGDKIQIVSDEDWAEAVGASPVSLRQWGSYTSLKPWLLRALWEHGEFSNSSGRTAMEVMNWLKEHWPEKSWPAQHQVMNTWSNPVNLPAVEMKVNGKRTFSLKLVALPETWYSKLQGDIMKWPLDDHQKAPENIPEPSQADREAAATMEAILMPTGLKAEAEASVALNGETQSFTDDDWAALQLDAPTVYEQPPPLEMQIANQVALSMLTTVVEIISSGSADTSQLAGGKQLARELEQAQHLLSQRLMENDKLRRQLREAGDSITALRVERDGLRSRLRMAEHNLSEVLKGETAQAVNHEIQKRVDQIMRTTPQPKGKDDG